MQQWSLKVQWFNFSFKVTATLFHGFFLILKDFYFESSFWNIYESSWVIFHTKNILETTEVL